MKKMFLICLLLIAGPAIASTQQVPALFNYQGVLLDEGGNPLPDGISNLKFQISDSAGNVLYEESQDVEIAKGQVSAIVGNGLNPVSGAPTGGIPSGVFDPTDTHYLQVEVEGQRPYDRLEIVATPYSLWADTALRLSDGALTSAMIGKGVIKKEHLDEELMGAIFPDGIPKGMLPKDTVYNEAFTSFRDTVQSNSGAGKVGVANTFIYSGSQTVQGVLSDFDLAIKKRQEEVEFSKRDYQAKVDAETNARIAADNAEMQSRGSADSALQKNIDSEAAIRSSGDSNLQGQLDSHAASTSTHGVLGNIVGTTDSQTLSNKTLSSPTIVGGNVSQNVTVSYGKKIDGVDISNHDHSGSGEGGTIFGYAIWTQSSSGVYDANKHINDDTLVTVPSNFNIYTDGCGVSLGVVSFNISDGIDSLCVKACVTSDGKAFRVRCRASSDTLGECNYYFSNGTNNSAGNCDFKASVGDTGSPCKASTRIVCAKS